MFCPQVNNSIGNFGRQEGLAEDGTSHSPQADVDEDETLHRTGQGVIS